jgi:hypothetical protein
MYTRAAYLKGDRVSIDTSKLTMIDMRRRAEAMDRLFAAGVHSINENREMMGLERIEEAYADRHFVTKNYAGAEQVAQGSETV